MQNQSDNLPKTEGVAPAPQGAGTDKPMSLLEKLKNALKGKSSGGEAAESEK